MAGVWISQEDAAGAIDGDSASMPKERMALCMAIRDGESAGRRSTSWKSLRGLGLL